MQLSFRAVTAISTADGGASKFTNDTTPTISGTTDAASGTTVTVSGIGSTLTGTATQTLTVDTTAPTVTITGGASALTNNPTPTISGTTTGAVGRTLTVTVTGQTLTTTVTGTGTWSVTTAALGDGTHSVVASVTDPAGNTGSATQALTVDTVPPVVAIDGGATAFTNDTTPTISGTTDAATGTTVTVTIAGQTLNTNVQPDGTWSVTPASLANGTYTEVASVTGPAGNTGTATQNLTVDAPENTTPAQTVTPGGTIAVSGKGFRAFENVAVWLYSTPVQLGTLTADAQGAVSGSFTVPAGTSLGIHHVVLIDSAGLELTSQAITVVAVLSFTGAEITAVWFGLAFLLIGGLALVFAADTRRKAKLRPE